ncbi:MAG TPA: NAD(P)H-dependent oxidoreductase subunit E [Candidatus Borkfalkia faecigallinarum]|uniref:NAD(P)H-dependent oxidoreductase subunit E n=1 Tax=Candidatus Borkfalkia faecigallinarum TaxID=2838509 RepID=A0A9D1VTN1_9FIRM|nr:NAD(P)H-dependent oxidoreductase subunit E [Candidatus Borkfalkia faecigallinarum]
MAKKIDVPFNGTKEQEAKLRAALAELKESHGDNGLMIAALQKAQDIYGYLPEPVQQIIAEELGTSAAEVYGVATFYAQFSLFPKGQYKIGVCLGTACYVKGSGDVYKKLCETLNIEGGQCTDDLKFSLDATRCIGCCGLAPVMTVNDDVYGKVTPEEIEGILAKYN